MIKSLTFALKGEFLNRECQEMESGGEKEQSGVRQGQA